jgi:mannose-1-phosphate guanylyltransferase/phosphomannomutase
MKGFILAAGEGSRLRPLTDTIPKPMVTLAGRPILEYAVEALARHGVRDLIMNLHHKPDVIRTYFGDGSRFGMRIQYSFEPMLLGTAGALAPWADFLDETFFLVYGDNLSTCDLTKLAAFHRARDAWATVALFWREDTRQSGVADLEPDGRIRRFVEKPAAGDVFSHWVNAGILVLEPACVADIPKGRPSDFGRELLPLWIAEGQPVYGYEMADDERLWWVDTPADLAHATREWEALHST